MRKYLVGLLLSLTLATTTYAGIFNPGGGGGGGSNHDMLSSTHSDTTPAAGVNGDIIRFNSTWQRLGIGSAGQCLIVSAGLPAWGACPSGAITIGSTTVTGGTASSFLYVAAGPVLQQVSLTGAVLGNGASAPTAYAGVTCTNQLLSALSTAIAGTCTTVTSAYVNTSIWIGSVSSGLLKAASQGVVAQAIPDTDYVDVQKHLVNAQTGTTYTVLTGDRAKLVTHSNASAIAVTLPQAGGSFPAGWYYWAQNRSTGIVTITPTTSTIDGASSIILGLNQGVLIVSDGTNYFTSRGIGGAPVDATYITQTTNGTLTNEQALSALATGCLNVTTGTGVVGSTGVACGGGVHVVTIVNAGNDPYTTLAGDEVLECDTTAANRTINLISVVTRKGKHYWIKNLGTNQCLIDGSGTQTIDGGTTATLTIQYEAIELVGNNGETGWNIF